MSMMDSKLLALLMVVVMMAPLTGSIAASSSASTQAVDRHAEAQIVEPDHLTSVPEQSDIWWDPHSKWWDVTTLDMDRNGIHDSIQGAVGPVNVGLSFTRAVTESDRQIPRFDRSFPWWTPSFWVPSIPRMHGTCPRLTESPWSRGTARWFSTATSRHLR